MVSAGGPSRSRCLLGWALAALLGARAAGLQSPPPEEFGEAGVHVVKLWQDKSPVFTSGSKTAIAFRVTYLGRVRIGSPPQEFTIMFDTGSGQVIVPHEDCHSKACMRHLRFDPSRSNTSQLARLSGSPLPPGKSPERVSIGFGVGSVSGNVVRDAICSASGERSSEGSLELAGGGHDAACTRMNLVVANELSPNPFGVFPFDGIIGLGLPPLSLTPEFGFFQAMRRAGVLRENKFSVWLAEGGDGSEIALGGMNKEQLASPVQWSPVVQPDQGHWQIEMLGFHVGNITLDHCRKGGCRGVVDSGTSHIAIPSPHESEVVDLLTLAADVVAANGISDCRHLDNYPTIIIELRDFNLTLYPEDYMRQLPVPVNIQLGAGSNNSTSTEKEEEEEEPELEIPRVCRPRVVGVSMPPEIGDKTFILGQSVLHRYYTVFDFDGPRVGFGLAAGRVESPGELEDFMRRREWPQSDPWPAAPPQWPELNPQDRQQQLHQHGKGGGRGGGARAGDPEGLPAARGRRVDATPDRRQDVHLGPVGAPPLLHRIRFRRAEGRLRPGRGPRGVARRAGGLHAATAAAGPAAAAATRPAAAAGPAAAAAAGPAAAAAAAATGAAEAA
jgi:hypothetical protein